MIDGRNGLRELAISTIKANDRGGYTVPTERLYPFQWNWDSAFAALGFATFDRDRAWLEIETLMKAQWQNGMVPHIVFWADDDGYYPGKKVWSSNTEPASSGHSQPPVVATIVRRLVETGNNEDLEKARTLFPSLYSYSKWFHDCRDPDGTGLVAITHPWESGRDNCPDWDLAMEQVMVDPDLGEYQRKDTSLVDASQRPTNDQYDRFLSLVKFGSECGWDPKEIYRNSPFLLADPGVQFVLLRSDRDLLHLAKLLGENEKAVQLGEWVAASEAGCDRLWSDSANGYCALDLRNDRHSPSLSSASMLAWYAGLDDKSRMSALAESAARILGEVSFGMPSWDPSCSGFESQRYWRGPVWAIMNFMISEGMAEQGQDDLSARVRKGTLTLFDKEGFWEYYDPISGKGVGGRDFTWTAAIALAWGVGKENN